MTLKAVGFAIGLAATASAASAATIFEDFESVATKDTALPSLTTAIGTFTPLAGVPFANVFVSSPGYSNYGSGNNPTTTSILTGNGDESFDVALSAASSAVSMDLYLNDLGPAVLSFFNGATLLQSFTFAADANSANNFLNQGYTTSGPAITRFTFVSTLGGQLNTGIDNIKIETISGAVPEPATWAMMIGGFGLVGGALRRQRREGQRATV